MRIGKRAEYLMTYLAKRALFSVVLAVFVFRDKSPTILAAWTIMVIFFILMSMRLWHKLFILKLVPRDFNRYFGTTAHRY